MKGNKKLDNYIAFNDQKIKQALHNRNFENKLHDSQDYKHKTVKKKDKIKVHKKKITPHKTLQSEKINKLSIKQKKKILAVLNYIKKNPEKSLQNKDIITEEIKRIVNS